MLVYAHEKATERTPTKTTPQSLRDSPERRNEEEKAQEPADEPTEDGPREPGVAVYVCLGGLLLLSVNGMMDGWLTCGRCGHVHDVHTHMQ